MKKNDDNNQHEIHNDEAQSEIEKLKTEVAELKHEKQHKASYHKRQIAVGIMIFFISIFLLLSTLIVWTRQTIVNTNNWIAIVGPLSTNSQVINTTSAYITNQAFANLNVPQRIQTALPSNAAFLTVPLTQLVHNFMQSSINRVLHSSAFQQSWSSANTFAHDQIISALEGNTKSLTTSNGEVTLNLVTVAQTGLKNIQQQFPNLIPSQVKIPDISSTTSPSAAQQQISQALGIQIPANFGQIPLFPASQLIRYQQLYKLLNILAVLLPIITLILFVAAVWISQNKRRTLMWIGAAAAITFIIERIAIAILQPAIIGALPSSDAQNILSPVITTVLDQLQTIANLIIVIGLALLALAYLFGNPKWLNAINAKLYNLNQWVLKEFERFKHTVTEGRAKIQ